MEVMSLDNGKIQSKIYSPTSSRILTKHSKRMKISRIYLLFSKGSKT